MAGRTRSRLEVLDEDRTRALQRALLPWYAANRRSLPWRATRDPYGIWVSEAMLQQTRVETVIPYWERFLARFPSVNALASAPDDELLSAWSGLGYYRRARSLREAARVLLARHAGHFPRTRAEALSLPGVGPYIAGAVLSIAYGQREALVDGNVARVLARLFALDALPSTAAGRANLWSLAERLLPSATDPLAATHGASGPGAWNQALMELGATLCRPRAPLCPACPLERLCKARGSGRELELPRRAPRPEPLDVRLELLLVLTGTHILLEQRPSKGRMAGLWELPTREIVGPDGRHTGLFPTEFADRRLRVTHTDVLLEVQHSITRHRIRAVVLRGVSGGRIQPGERVGWFERGGMGDVALTGMARKVTDWLEWASPTDVGE